jgi:hypothetical protein
MAQPPLEPIGPLNVDSTARCPVERAIAIALDR